MVAHLTQDIFKKEIAESTKPVVIDVYASWCGPCQLMAPIFEEVAQAHSDSVTFYKLNVDEERELAAHLNVSSIPMFFFFNKGTLVFTESGFINKGDFEAKIAKLINS